MGKEEELLEQWRELTPEKQQKGWQFGFFGLCYAMDWGYKGWNPYVERHLAIFVNCFLSRANSSIKSLAREGFSQFMPPYRTITSNEEPQFVQILKSESQTTPEAKFIPQTPLSKKLWEIRHRAILAGLQLLNEEEIEQELAARRGGCSES